MVLFQLHHLLTLMDLYSVLLPPPLPTRFSTTSWGNSLCSCLPPFKPIKPGSSPPTHPPTIPSPTTFLPSSSWYLAHFWQPLPSPDSETQSLLVPPAPAPIIFNPLMLLVVLTLLLTYYLCYVLPILCKTSILFTSSSLLQASHPRNTVSVVTSQPLPFLPIPCATSCIFW